MVKKLVPLKRQTSSDTNIDSLGEGDREEKIICFELPFFIEDLDSAGLLRLFDHIIDAIL